MIRHSDFVGDDGFRIAGRVLVPRKVPDPPAPESTERVLMILDLAGAVDYPDGLTDEALGEEMLSRLETADLADALVAWGYVPEGEEWSEAGADALAAFLTSLSTPEDVNARQFLRRCVVWAVVTTLAKDTDPLPEAA